MSIELVKQLVDAAGSTAEVCGGNVVALVEGKKTLLGGPSGDSNTFSVTDEGRAVLDAAREAAKPVVEKAKPSRRKPTDVEPEVTPYVPDEGLDLS